MEEYVVEEMCKKYGKSKSIIIVMLEKAEKLGYNKEDFYILLKEFYSKS